MPAWKALALIIAGLVGLVVGGEVIVKSATSIAHSLGVSDAIIGLTVVAFGTSLPELATSVVAALKKEQDIAIGNIVGSNIFNILCIMGISPMIKPIAAQGITLVDFAVMLAISFALWMMMLFGKKINRAEGLAFLVVNAGYVGYLIYQTVK